ncbi:Multidrug efflux pump subunit AcrB [Monaibacterium marinum]|uniref:Multidrug efflux pump subunit AcrB n=1 Tax=Pontivivens marinum TaxID=1690039 RepID=A0A2C9CPN4_9RHOB|nr:efflux RND transporter permease subunit [Monaibacterium marinum]SOH93178.1 Multidrug efflux pump subunit AcrB [Monaibacterium marinum]
MLSYFVRHRTAANLILVIMVALGLAALTQIRAQFFPDVIVDNVSVSVSWDGAGPEDVDNAIVAPLEPVLLAVEGVIATTAVASEGSASLRMEFEPGWDMARAADDVETAVASIRTFPEGADDPVVRRGQWRDRVTNVVISGPVGVEQLGRYADEFVARLFREGVTRTTTSGFAAPSIAIEVPEAALIRNDLTLATIAQAIGDSAETDPAGEVAGGAARVRTGVARRTAEEIAQIAVRTEADGSALLVRDVATVIDEGISRNQAYFVGENPAVSIRVDRSDQGDAIQLQATVDSVAQEMQQTLPDGVTITLTNTRAEAISDRIDILLDNGLMGLGLVVALLFLFLSARTAIWVAAGIPVAMLATVAMMFAFGITINMISLFALIICLGIVVDDAIVVGEHADFRHRHLGETPENAAINAAKRMSLPVLSSTITTVIAFSALAVIGGRFGSLILDIPFTVSVVLLASLVECFLILPAHMRHALAAQTKTNWYDLPSYWFNRGFDVVNQRLFRPFMRLVLALRYPVLGAAFAIFAYMLSLFFAGDVTWRFFNSPEQSELTGNIAMVNGTTRAETLAMVVELDRAVTQVGQDFEAEYGRNPIVFAMTQIGGSAGRAIGGSDQKDADQLGSIAIEILDADNRPYSAGTLQQAIEDAIIRHPKLETLSFRRWGSGPGGDGLSVQLFGADAQTLKDASENFQAILTDYEVVTGVEDDLPYDKTELILELTPRGAALGLTTETIGRELRQRLGGIEALTFPVGVRSGTVTVRMPEDELTADFVERTRVQTGSGTWVPLSEVVSVRSQLGFSRVLRENGQRIITVSGQMSEDDPAHAAEVTQEIRDVILPRVAGQFGVEFLMTGLAEQERDFLNEAMIGFALCLLGIYLTLCWIFSSWLRPIVVMAIIPFGLTGTIWGHYIWGVPMSMFTVIGLLGMTGIIINDSIVLITTIDEYAETRGLLPALVDAVCDRLRPVLLTTLTTVLGLAPLLYESSQQAQFLKPTVITLCYGLGFGMILVLLVVPAIIGMQMDAGRLSRSLRRAVTGRHVPRGPRVVLVGATLLSVLLTVGYVVLSARPELLPVQVPLLPLFAGGLVAIALISGVLVPVMTPRRAITAAE